MSATSEMPAVPLARFAMLSFATAAFGICFMLTRQCFSCVRSIAYVNRLLLKKAVLISNENQRQSYLDTNENIEDALVREVNRFLHFVCWSGISFALFLVIATNFVGNTLNSHANIAAYQELIEQASKGDGSVIITGDIPTQVPTKTLPNKELALFSLSVLSLAMAAIKIFRSHCHANARQDFVGRIPVELLAFTTE